jgi:hypothetical protein
MKKMFAILLIIVLGIALGVEVAVLKIKAAPWQPTLDQGKPAAGSSTTHGDKPGTKATQVGRVPAVAGLAGGD